MGRSQIYSAVERLGPLVWAIALLTFCGFLYFWGLGDIPFYTKGEPREATELQEILVHGDWILPMRNGDELPSKPPLFHWLGAFAASMTGEIDELSARLPSAVLATLTVLGVFGVGAKRWGTRAGIFAALVLSTNFEWMRAATTARVDMTLTAFLVAALLALWIAAEWSSSPRWPVLLSLYVTAGLAALGKGPVGILLPGLVAFVYLAVRRDLGVRRILSFRPLAGGLVTLAIAGSWYALAGLQGGDAFVHKHFYVENLGRFFSAGASGAGHEHPFYYLIGGFFTGFAPWSLFTIPLGVFLWRNRHRLEDEGGDLFLIVWAGAIFVFYSLSASKRTVYLLPVYPAVALLLGSWWQRLCADTSVMPPIVVRALKAAGIVTLVAFVVVLLLVIAQSMDGDPIRHLQPLLHPKDQANLPIVQAVIRAHPTLLTIWAFFVLGIVGLFMVSLHEQRWATVFATVLVATVAVAAVVNGIFHPALARQRTFKPFMKVVREVVKPEDRLYFRDTWDYGAIFYSGRRIPAVSGGFGEPPRGSAGHYTLLWESTWNGFSASEKGPLTQLVLKSEGTGPKGADRLVLVRVQPGAVTGVRQTTASNDSEE